MMGLGMNSGTGAPGCGVGPFFFFGLGKAYHWRSAQTRTVSSAAVSQYLSRRRRCPKLFVCPKRRSLPFSVDTRAAGGDFEKGGPGGDSIASRNRKTGTDDWGREGQWSKGELGRFSSSASPARARRARVGLAGWALRCSWVHSNFAKSGPIRRESQLERTKEIKSKKDDGLFKGVTEG